MSLRPVWSLSHPRRPFVVEVLQPMSLPPSSAPTATGWSDSCRAGFAPAEEWRLVTAHRNSFISSGLLLHTRDLKRSGRSVESAPFPHVMVEWMLWPKPPPDPAEPSAEDAIPTRRSRPPSFVPPRPVGTPTATACTCSSSRPEREAGSSGSSSGDAGANSDSAPPGWSPWPRPASWPSPTASSPAPGAIPSPRSAARTEFPPSPRPPSACSNRSAAAGAAGGTRRTGVEHGTLRLAAHRPPASFRGQHGRRAGDPYADLARQGGDGPRRAPAHPVGAGVGHRDGPAERQPVRSGGAGARPAE